MTFKPTTYLISFALFVVLFMALGGYYGYKKIADHFVIQAFLDATSLDARFQVDQKGTSTYWEEKVALEQGLFLNISASNQPKPILINYSDEANSTARNSHRLNGISLAPHETTEDIRIDKSTRYLYARVRTTSKIKSEEITWLYKYDLQKRGLSSRTAVNPIFLPAVFKP